MNSDWAISLSAKSFLFWLSKIWALSFLCFTSLCRILISSDLFNSFELESLVSNKIIADFIALSDSNLIESFYFIADFKSSFMVILSDIF